MVTRRVAVGPVIGLVALGATGCGGTTGGGSDLYDPPVADASTAGDGGGAASRHVECTGDVAAGGRGPDFGAPRTGAPDPDGALRAFLAQDLFALPADPAGAFDAPMVVGPDATGAWPSTVEQARCS